MSKYAIQASVIGKQIHIGRLNKAGRVFLEKQVATDEALHAVADFVRRNFGGGMSMTFQAADGEEFEMNVIVKAITPTPEHDDQEDA